MNKPVLLVVAPMPVFPTSAGNRKRLLATCELLENEGFLLDFAYVAHEDQIYRRFGQEPPTDMAAMCTRFRRTYRIEVERPIKIKTRAHAFGLDDWSVEELDDFLTAYFKQTPECGAILVNYVFLSKCLASVPAGIVTIIDTHDRFGNRKAQYAVTRGDPNFFYCTDKDEAAGLRRADLILAIQERERDHFRYSTGRDVLVLPPALKVERNFGPPRRLEAVGFVGHGNDANLVSISTFADHWSRLWRPELPILKIAGEICTALPSEPRPGIELLGYVAKLEDFYDAVELIVAPMSMGTGLKLKVAEGLAFGKPVVGTALAFEGFPTRSADHCLPGPEAVANRIAAISDEPSAMGHLIDECVTLFRDYARAAEEAGVTFAKAVKARIGVSAGVPMRSAASEPDLRQVVAYGRVEIVEGEAPAAPSLFTAEGVKHVATERPYYDDPIRDLGTYSPCARRWFVRRGATITTEANSPLAGRRIIAAPALIDCGSQDEQMLWGVRSLSEARPDWLSTGARLLQVGNDWTLETLWPTALIAQGVRLSMFLIPNAFAPAVPVKIAKTMMLFGSPSRTSVVEKTCGDWPLAPAALRLEAASARDATGWRAVVVLAVGLVGLIDMSAETVS